MQDEEYIRIPLGGRFKNKPVTAWALVDAADAPLLLKSRWCLNRPVLEGGYAIRNVRLSSSTYSKYKSERMSRVILGLAWGDPRQVDHINGDPLDNRRSNLRIVTNAENAQNMKAHGDAVSAYRGVSWFKPKQKWRARVCINYQTYECGYFDDELEAALAAQAFRLKHLPFTNEARSGIPLQSD